MFFDSWQGIARVAIVGTLAYVALVALLRVSGKRTLSKLNAFDLVVTVALGSTLATLLLFRGRVLDDALRRERITRDELLAEVRACGRAGIAQVHAVVLETDGSLNIIGPPSEGGDAGLAAVERPPDGQGAAGLR